MAGHLLVKIGFVEAALSAPFRIPPLKLQALKNKLLQALGSPPPKLQAQQLQQSVGPHCVEPLDLLGRRHAANGSAHHAQRVVGRLSLQPPQPLQWACACLVFAQAMLVVGRMPVTNGFVARAQHALPPVQR